MSVDHKLFLVLSVYQHSIKINLDEDKMIFLGLIFHLNRFYMGYKFLSFLLIIVCVSSQFEQSLSHQVVDSDLSKLSPEESGQSETDWAFSLYLLWDECSFLRIINYILLSLFLLFHFPP